MTCVNTSLTSAREANIPIVKAIVFQQWHDLLLHAHATFMQITISYYIGSGIQRKNKILFKSERTTQCLFCLNEYSLWRSPLCWYCLKQIFATVNEHVLSIHVFIIHCVIKSIFINKFIDPLNDDKKRRRI